jgi:hypothetical protein
MTLCRPSRCLHPGRGAHRERPGNSLRLAGTFEFNVTQGVFASSSYGKDADDETGAGRTFVLFGLTFPQGQRKLRWP